MFILLKVVFECADKLGGGNDDGYAQSMQVESCRKAVNKNTLYSCGMHIIRFKWGRKEKVCPLLVLWESTKLGFSPADTGSSPSVTKDFFDQSCARLFPGGNSTAKTDPRGVQSSGLGFSPKDSSRAPSGQVGLLLSQLSLFLGKWKPSVRTEAGVAKNEDGKKWLSFPYVLILILLLRYVCIVSPL